MSDSTIDPNNMNALMLAAQTPYSDDVASLLLSFDEKGFDYTSLYTTVVDPQVVSGYTNGTELSTHSAGGFTVNVKSKGTYHAGEDVSVIDMAELTTGHKDSNWINYETTWGVYSAVDASDATSEVTYYGLGNEKWYNLKGTDTKRTMAQVENDMSNVTNNHSTTYRYNNNFKGGDYGNTVYGGGFNDTLIGGAGDDYINGGEGNDRIVGVGGDNTLIGGAGDDTIFGGTDADGSDYIVTGTGDNVVVLANGDNFVVVEQNEIADETTTTYANKIVSGSGADTFVIGNNIPASETVVTSEMKGFLTETAESGALKLGESVLHAGLEHLKANPLWGVLVSTTGTVLDHFLGGTPDKEVTTTEWPTFDSSYIYNFNPLEDRLIMPMGEGSLDALQVETGGITDDYDFEIMDGNSNVILRVTLENDLLGSDHTLTNDEKAAFAYSIIDTALVVSGDEVLYGTNTSVDESAYDSSLLDDMGTSKFMYLGNWGGNYLMGINANNDTTAPIFMGSNFDDVMYASDPNNYVHEDAGLNAVYYGFGGDDLFVVGTGNDRIVAGTGDNTVSFEWQEYGVVTDMSSTQEDSLNTDLGDAVKVMKGDWNTAHFSYMWNVESIKGSGYDDTITGDDADNTFYSTGGDNTWTGGEGSDTFVLDGGSSTITDFVSSEDTITIYVDSYVADTSDSDFKNGTSVSTDTGVDTAYMSDLEWDEEDDGSWTLHDNYNDADIVTVLNSDGSNDTAPDVTIFADADDTIGVTGNPNYYDSPMGA